MNNEKMYLRMAIGGIIGFILFSFCAWHLLNGIAPYLPYTALFFGFVGLVCGSFIGLFKKRKPDGNSANRL